MSCVKQSVGWWWDNQIQTFSAVSVRDDVIHQHLLHPAMIVTGSGSQAGWLWFLIQVNWILWVLGSIYANCFAVSKACPLNGSAPFEDWSVRLLDGRLILADKLWRICWEWDWLLHCSDSVIPATRPASNLQDAVLALRHVPPRPARSAVQPQG